jgi:hypothetical protein
VFRAPRIRVTDLPLSGRIVQLVVTARLFRYDVVVCGRQIFTEGVLAPSVRRTTTLDCIVHHLGLALGGRPAAGFAKRLLSPVSKDTLLRVVTRNGACTRNGGRYLICVTNGAPTTMKPAIKSASL